MSIWRPQRSCTIRWLMADVLLDGDVWTLGNYRVRNIRQLSLLPTGGCHRQNKEWCGNRGPIGRSAHARYNGDLFRRQLFPWFSHNSEVYSTEGVEANNNSSRLSSIGNVHCLGDRGLERIGSIWKRVGAAEGPLSERTVDVWRCAHLTVLSCKVIISSDRLWLQDYLYTHLFQFSPLDESSCSSSIQYAGEHI